MCLCLLTPSPCKATDIDIQTQALRWAQFGQLQDAKCRSCIVLNLQMEQVWTKWIGMTVRSLVKGLPAYLCFVDIYDVYKDAMLAWQIQYQTPLQTYAHIKPSKFCRFHNPLPWEEGHRHYHRSSWKHPEVAWFGPEETHFYINSRSFLAIWSCTNPSPHWAVQQWYAMLPLPTCRNK